MSMQLFVLTITVKNLQATEKNPIKVNYFPPSNYCFYNARETTESEEDKVCVSFYIHNTF